jgi:hypothetical protein
MTGLKHLLTGILMAVSEHGNILLHKGINWFGAISISAGVTLGAATDTASRIAQPDMWHLSDWAAVVSIAGGISFLVKNAVDVYFKIKNKGRE